MDVDLEGKYHRDAAALQAAKGIMAQKSFLLLFFICFAVAAVGLLTIGISGPWGWVLVAVVSVLGGVGGFSGKMDEMMTLGVAGIGAVCGVISLVVAVFVVLGIR